VRFAEHLAIGAIACAAFAPEKIKELVKKQNNGYISIRNYS
jgi:hypothetical protein